MTRGYLYEITDNPDLYDMDRLTGVLDQDPALLNEFSYGEEPDETEKAKAIKDLLAIFKDAGATITFHNDTQLAHMTFPDTFAKQYFSERYQQLQQEFAYLTLEDFAKNVRYLIQKINPELKNVAGIKELIDDETSDAVWFNSSFYNLDSFVRQIEPDKTYYLYPNVLNMCY